MNDTSKTRIEVTPEKLKALHEKAERFDRFTHCLPAMLYDYIIDRDWVGRCLYCSDYSLELLGVPPDVFMADMNQFWNLIHPEDLPRFREADIKANRHDKAFSMDTRVILANGEQKWLRVSSTKTPDSGNELVIWSGYMIDISETKQLEAKLKEQATHDFLTGLGNRNFFQRYFQEELQRRDRYQRQSAVLLLDLDHFKSINDRYGHEAGDFVLKEVSQRIQAQLRAVDVLARWGGEEFCILLPESSQKAALAAAERIRSDLEKSPVDFQGQRITVTTSIGVTAIEPPDTRLEAVVGRADKALYQAKNNGRNQIASG